MQHIEDSLHQQLEARGKAGLLRTLAPRQQGLDLCSNDYLGFAKHPGIQEKLHETLRAMEAKHFGSTGSRLISGNHAFIEALEQELADFHQAQAGLIFSSGYAANTGLFACIASRGDTLVLDELIHASMIDGVRLSYAKRLIFRHNDLKDLEDKLKQAEGRVFIGVESVYSMDGDLAPLRDIVTLAQQYNAAVIVDEAHGTGVFGQQGAGLVVEQDLQEQIFARVHTFGKALGTHGAIVVGSKILREYLVNFARPFIYSTGLPLHTLVHIQCAYQELFKSEEKRLILHKNIAYFRQQAARLEGCTLLESPSCIQSLVIPGNQKVRYFAHQLQERGFWVKPIVSPTVAKGKERLRICIHSDHTKDQIQQLIETVQDIARSL